MSKLFIIVERKEDWTSYYPSEDVVTAQEYLELPIDDDTGKRVQVINLCRHYKYLRHGYYCSLLAEARGHKVIPSVRTISELARKSLYSLVLEDLDRTLDKALAAHPYGSTDGFTLTLYFGRTDIEPLQDLARQLFEAFPCPLLLVEFKRNRTWHIEGIKPGAIHKLREDQEDLFANALDSFSRQIWRKPRSRKPFRYDLAILHDPGEAFPPSDAKALKNFVRVGRSLGIDVDLIERYDADQLVTLMVGRDLGERFDLGPRQTGAPLLRVERLSRRGKVHEVSFEVRAGEIFGISGLIGSGRTELLRLIYGADRADGGQVLLGDPPQRLSLRSPADSVRQGVALITEDRKGEGLLLDQSISANLALGNLPALARHGVIDRRREEALARRQVEALRVRCADTAQAVGELSGGNQQKVVIGRWLERDCQVLLFDEPTRGIDVGAKFDIYALLAELTRRGKALVVVSSDLRELMLICDRIGVLSAGRMVDTFERDAWTQDALLAAAFAGYKKRDALLATS